MKVLLGLAGGDESITALEQTVERTIETGDELTVALIEKPEAARSQDEMHDQVEQLLSEAGLDASVEQLEGDPGSSLVEYAERGSFDQLVIGGGTLSPMGKIQLGPITEFVLLNSPITVTLIR